MQILVTIYMNSSCMSRVVPKGVGGGPTLPPLFATKADKMCL